MTKLILPILSCVLCLQLLPASSLWNNDSVSRIMKKQDFKVGETVTVLIEESLNAVQSGSTRSVSGTNVGLNVNNRMSQSFSPLAAGRTGTSYSADDELRQNLAISGQGSYTGTGQTTRESSIRTTITATIIDVQPNGNIFIMGQRQIKVNNESEVLEVSGVVSVDKISDNNTILSTQLANAKITIKGAGVVSSPQSPGVITKMFDWLF